MIRDQRYWPKFGEHTTVEPNKLDLALRLAFNGIYDIHDAFSAQMATATLHATVNAGVVTVVDVLTAGSYTLVPTIKAVGGCPESMTGGGRTHAPMLVNRSWPRPQGVLKLYERGWCGTQTVGTKGEDGEKRV